MSLALVRLTPDVRSFAQWGAQKRFMPQGGDDPGYALHAALKAAMGDFAPRPFYWRETGERRVELLGYVASSAQAFLEAIQIANGGPDLRLALGLDHADARDMPQAWREGRVLSFECRVRPVIRPAARGARTDSKVNPRNREIDAAVAAWIAAEQAGIAEADRPSKEEAYGRWMSARLAHGGAKLDGFRLISSRRTRVLRRPKSDESIRKVHTLEGPDVVLRGQLSVVDPSAFASILSRGVGRHCAFGFGMLMVAPPGVFA